MAETPLGSASSFSVRAHSPGELELRYWDVKMLRFRMMSMLNVGLVRARTTYRNGFGRLLFVLMR